ncbi:MAG: C10 family peptidase [Bacteroidales bacterium]|nr:C10 family peptidase [Bacteroidales bacterium]MCF8327081.1 C10 family peptidase [Bacteroidales bacterium]
MKQLFSVGIFIFLLVAGINAQSVNKNEIQSAALGFIQQQDEITVNKQPGSLESQAVMLDGEEVARLVNINDSGFVLMATDKRQKPVIGYSFRNDLDTEQMPPALKSWLKGNSQVSLQNRSEHPEWQQFLSGQKKNRSFPEVPIMLSSVWAQSWPYNAACPEHASGSHGHTLVGCVATAMGQIMNYWEYPESGEGNATHFWGEYYTVHFDQANYDWTVIDDYINNYNQDEIAELNYHAAVSVNMNFGPNASGSSISKAKDALKDHFKYLPTLRFLNRSNYAYDEWKTMMQNEMLSNRPVLYAGVDSTTQGGHAFVMDGFRDSAYFHFNWGWGGSANGYFHLNNMASGGGNFAMNQRAVIGIMPPDASYCGDHWMTAGQYEFDDGSGYSLYKNNSACTYLIEHPDAGALKLQFTKWSLADAGDKVTLYDGADKNAPVLASFDGSQNPSMITSSSNKVFIEFETNDSGIDQGWKLNYFPATTAAERNQMENLQILPNPADDVVYIKGAVKGSLTLYSIDGHKILKKNIYNSQQSIDVSELTPGFYLLNITSETGYRKVKKLIVK